MGSKINTLVKYRYMKILFKYTWWSGRMDSLSFLFFFSFFEEGFLLEFQLWGKLFVISYMIRGNYQAKPMFERTKTIF